MTARILIVEDEAVLRSSMVRSISKLDTVEVDGAGSLADARALIQAATPTLVISDLDLPDGSGLQLLADLQGAVDIPVILVTAHLGVFADEIPNRSGIEIVEKPISMIDLREMVRQRIRGPAPDETSPFTFDEYVQLACIGNHSLAIDVSAQANAGTVYVWQGDVHSASDGEGDGAGAFMRLARCALAEGARIVCRGLQAIAHPRSIRPQAWQNLLFDAARLHDEDSRITPAANDADPFAGLSLVDDGGADGGAGDEREDQPKAPLEFERLCELGIEALLDRDYPQALVWFLEAEQRRPNDPLVRSNIQRLRELGFEADASA